MLRELAEGREAVRPLTQFEEQTETRTRPGRAVSRQRASRTGAEPVLDTCRTLSPSPTPPGSSPGAEGEAPPGLLGPEAQGKRGTESPHRQQALSS